MNYNEFNQNVIEIASELKAEYDLADALDHVHEVVDGLQAVIYYAQAWDLVNMIRECNYSLYQDAQSMVSEDLATDYDDWTDLNKLMIHMAYAIYTVALNDYLYKSGE